MSGDVIIRHLAAYLKPEYVVFLVSFFRDMITYYCISWTELCGSLSNHLLFLSAQPESDSSKMVHFINSTPSFYSFLHINCTNDEF